MPRFLSIAVLVDFLRAGDRTVHPVIAELAEGLHAADIEAIPPEDTAEQIAAHNPQLVAGRLPALELLRDRCGEMAWLVKIPIRNYLTPGAAATPVLGPDELLPARATDGEVVVTLVRLGPEPETAAQAATGWSSIPSPDEIRLTPGTDGHIRIQHIGEILDHLVDLAATEPHRRYLSIDPGGIAEQTLIGVGTGVPGVNGPRVRITIDPISMTELAFIVAGFVEAWNPADGVVDTAGLGVAFWAALRDRIAGSRWRPISATGNRLTIPAGKAAAIVDSSRLP